MDTKQNYNQLFVGGDLSGIQKFLYNISSKKASVSLKGRSYYIRKYMEDVCENIKNAADANGATHTKVIYCSGGKFYLITENSPQVTQAIDECAMQSKQALWNEHKGQLGLSISHVAFKENSDGSVDCQGLTQQKPGMLWKVVNADFARQKQQKFKEQLIKNYRQFFNPIPVGGKPKVCAVTGIESSDCIKMDDEDYYVLPVVLQQIRKGEELRRNEHFKTFEDYADNTYLGILRMDVDGLGKRLADGFASIHDYEEFSGRLVSFFEDGVKKMQQEPEFREHLNIIYAGGDDLFIVGRWDKLIDFAERIHHETATRFSDEGLSISGGIAVVKSKYPIAKAAEMAGMAEEAAKQFRNGEKNAFHLLGKTISWDKEFDYVKSLKQQFVELIDNYGISKGLLHKLMLYSSLAEQNKIRRAEGQNEDFSYVWHISYYLTRYMNRYKNNKVVYDFCRSLRDNELDYKKGRNLELIALAARWAELIEKDNTNNKKQ